jgi:lactoylglutathione lyase
MLRRGVAHAPAGVPLKIRRKPVPGFREAFPILYAADVDRAVAFYRNAFGFEIGFRWPAEGPLEFAYLRLEPLGIGIGGRNGTPLHGGSPDDPRGGFELCLYTDDVDAAAARLRELGAPILVEPADQAWGERLLFTRDPDGTPIQVTMKLPATA